MIRYNRFSALGGGLAFSWRSTILYRLVVGAEVDELLTRSGQLVFLGKSPTAIRITEQTQAA